MLFRAEQARWFETYVPREQTVLALDLLAGTHRVALESDTQLASPLELTALREALADYRELLRRHGDLLAHAQSSEEAVVKDPESIARDALGELHRWSERIEKLLQEQGELEARQRNLAYLLEYLTARQGENAEILRLSHRSEFLFKGLFVCPKSHRLEAEVCAALDEFVAGTEHDFFVVADLPDRQRLVEQGCRDRRCESVAIPDGMAMQPEIQLRQVEDGLEKLAARLDELSRALLEAQRNPRLIAAVQAMDLLAWFVENSDSLSGNHRLCHVTGWTTDATPEALQRLLRSKAILSVVRFARPPEHVHPPVSLLLPGWAQPFLPFVEMLGTPGWGEVNPVMLMPVIVSLLFGYMFPDVGHGLLLVLASLLLYRRWPKGRFLIPCGLSAILFGFIFGEIFGLEGVLEPWWLSPLEDPLKILVPPVFFGIGLMLLGLVFNGIEAHWRGDLRDWLLRDAAVLTLYAALLAGIFETRLLGFAALALLWFLLGQLYQTLRGRRNKPLSNLAMLLQSLFELSLNTLSFLRVGAFALAHAALSSAVMQMVAGIDNQLLHVTLLLAGNLLIVVLEGLVVFVQTTRLVLFEFCTRFLRAEGRIFRPLVSANLQGEVNHRP